MSRDEEIILAHMEQKQDIRSQMDVIKKRILSLTKGGNAKLKLSNVHQPHQ